MKILAAFIVVALSTPAFAAKYDLMCAADDFSPIVVTVKKTASGLNVFGKINGKTQKPLPASGVLKSDEINLSIGYQGGSIYGNGFGGHYGVLPVTIPEYGIHAIRMLCISETVIQ
jgi:hypothetical protein